VLAVRQRLHPVRTVPIGQRFCWPSQQYSAEDALRLLQVVACNGSHSSASQIWFVCLGACCCVVQLGPHGYLYYCCSVCRGRFPVVPWLLVLLLDSIEWQVCSSSWHVVLGSSGPALAAGHMVFVDGAVVCLQGAICVWFPDQSSLLRCARFLSLTVGQQLLLWRYGVHTLALFSTVHAWLVYWKACCAGRKYRFLRRLLFDSAVAIRLAPWCVCTSVCLQ
jgi:hypothetical protein